MILFDDEEEKQTSADAVSARVSISFSNFFANVSQKKKYWKEKPKFVKANTHTRRKKKQNNNSRPNFCVVCSLLLLYTRFEYKRKNVVEFKMKFSFSFIYLELI